MDHGLGEPRALASSPSTQSSASEPVDSLPNAPYLIASADTASNHYSSSGSNGFRRPSVSYSQLQRLRRLRMSGFLSSEAERVFMGDGSDPNALWPDDSDLYMSAGFQTPLVDEGAGWAHAHSDASGFDYFHPFPPNMPQQYMLPTQASAGGHPQQAFYSMPMRAVSVNVTSSMAYDQGGMTSTAMSTPGSTSMQQPMASPPLLSPPSHSGTSSRGRSRSPSPHVSTDLQNYGKLNSDRRTWRCAYPGCHSKAVFVRPCDLRKHFHRHEKKFFCRYDGCAQSDTGARNAAAAAAAQLQLQGAPASASASTSSASHGGQGGVGATGGFSSKKDRARHEAKHNPGVGCDWEGCERIFSRVDNMKDHYRRIHLKEKERRRLSDHRSDEDQ